MNDKQQVEAAQAVYSSTTSHHQSARRNVGNSSFCKPYVRDNAPIMPAEATGS